MRPFDYLRILMRRWWILVLGALIGSLFAFVTQPSTAEVTQTSAPRVAFRATHLLLADPTSNSRLAGSIGYDRLALWTITGPVRDAALKRLGGRGWPTMIKKSGSVTDNSATTATGDGALAEKRRQEAEAPIPKFKTGRGQISVVSPKGLVIISAYPDPPTGALAIVATGGKYSSVEAANTFADELLKYMNRLGQQRFDDDLADLRLQLRLAQQSAADLDVQALAASQAGNFVLQNALVGQRADQAKKIFDINASIVAAEAAGPQKSDLQSFDPASVEHEATIVAPGGSSMSSAQRLLVGGGIGFLLGLALLVMMELLGARIRDVAGAEGAARMPVIAEIPVVKMNRADRFFVATSNDPASLMAEAYRSLRTSLLAMWQRHPRNTPLPGAEVLAHGRGRPLRTLLVTSPGPAEGKSITVVNLAAAFAETGMTVLVVDADFRRPTQYRYLERPRDPNLGDLDISCSAEDLEAILQETDIPGVRLAASAPSKADPGHAIAVAKAAAQVGLEIADLVIIDSPPLLLANDASDIALDVDASILLARAGWTRRSGIVASADLLRRLEAPVIGVVIVGAEHGVRAGYYGYYGYYGYGYGYAHPGEVSVMQRLMPWKAGKKGAGAGSRGSRPVPAPHTGATVVEPRASAQDPDDPWV